MPYKKQQHGDDVAGRFVSEMELLKKEHPDIWDKVGISSSQFSHIKAGNRYPTVDHLTNLVKHYHYSGTWLLTGTGDRRNEPATPSVEKKLAAIQEQLAKINTRLDLEQETGGNKKGNKTRETGTK
ncbi:hypothetical protein HF324_18585 [Chitinophaga oryzae]|uniref:XRE family transcriptional regulator n=1 Tax=Chitinophaga oryzae TaxID=2725414 RepID=A0ABX6LI98_9BACT|nr:hypothetical protein [Chitinophaga oryzae]QJB39756.1 hypothetical protein HF324_18585 [Chitinophaga oryzae]